SPAFGGTELGPVGPYERLHGTLFGELDPTHRLNAGILNLDRAARNARGNVEYQSDFRILKPLDLDRGNGCLVYDVPNRGNQPIMPRLNGAPDGGHPEHAGNAFVMGIGFAAIRDIVSFLRHETKDNPLAPQQRPRIRHALGFGISQSGRVLRDLVHLGFNQDLAGRQVFDGILPVVAGSRRTCINWEFAQAGRYSRQHEDHSYGDDQFPLSYPTLSDPISGRSGGILQRARDAGVCPKVLHLDTESDLWQARSSLVVTDISGADLAMPAEVRVYTVGGV